MLYDFIVELFSLVMRISNGWMRIFVIFFSIIDRVTSTIDAAFIKLTSHNDESKNALEN